MEDKVKEAIELLRKGEKVAISLNPEGYYVAFSGGKDSQALLELVRMAEVKYKAYYSVTSIDPPESVYFIRENYPEVQFVHHAENFFRLVRKKGLPTIQHRWCCEKLKENLGAGSVVLTGVRAEESKKRAAYVQLDVASGRKEHLLRTRPYSFEEFEREEHRCIKGKDKIMLRPVLTWTSEEIWQFLYKRGRPINPCYGAVDRVGCMFCPYSSVRNIAYWENRHPEFKALLLCSLQVYLDGREQREFETAEEYFEWWKSKKSIKEYKRRKGI